jgi:hypothetical protein
MASTDSARAASKNAVPTSTEPHQCGSDAVFFERPALNGNTAEKQKTIAVAMDSGRAHFILMRSTIAR